MSAVQKWGLVLLVLGVPACIEGVEHDGRDWVDPNESTAFETVEQAAIDCSERADTGYVRGDAFRITVVTVDGKPVERETANAFSVMQQAARNDGVNLRIVSGFRTQDEQRRLYACYTNCNCNNCNLAARPGYSNHQSGHALDLNTSDGSVLRWLNNNGGRFGFRRTVPSESWHWEWWGGGPGGGPCSGAPCKVIGRDGGVVDNGGSCFQAMGPANLWRTGDGVGRGGSHKWTKAWVSDEPSNWAQWNLHLDRAGRYEVLVSTDGGAWSRTRYKVRHDGVTNVRRLDQSVEGWQSLGVFAFARGGEQWVKVFDNYDAPARDNLRIVADAVRLRPYVDPCTIGPDGKRVDDDAGCVQLFGPGDYWRREDAGIGGGLRWTNAFTGDAASNWARWNLSVEEAGRYEVEVATGGRFGVWAETRYRVRHNGTTRTRTIDQSLDGWQSLGDFQFAAGADQWVAVYDNYEGQIPADQRIAVDAIRVRPWAAPEDPPDGDDEEADPPDEPEDLDETPEPDVNAGDPAPPDGPAPPDAAPGPEGELPDEPGSAVDPPDPGPLEYGRIEARTECSSTPAAPRPSHIWLTGLLVVALLARRRR